MRGAPLLGCMTVVAALASATHRAAVAQTCDRTCAAGTPRDARGCCETSRARPSADTHSTSPATGPRSGGSARTPAVVPAFDLTGHWDYNHNVAQIFQEEDRVTMISNFAAGHFLMFIGRYVTPTVVTGELHRRAPGCNHSILRYSMSVESANRFTTQWSFTEVRDCNTPIGTAGVDNPFRRIPAPQMPQ